MTFRHNFILLVTNFVLLFSFGCGEDTRALTGLLAEGCEQDSDCDVNQFCNINQVCDSSGQGGLDDVDDIGMSSQGVDTDEPDATTIDSLECESDCRDGEQCVEGQCVCLEGAQRGCGNKVGECRYGVQVCEGEIWSECREGITPVDEVCDQLDNDCDGLVDEGVLLTMYTDADNDGFASDDSEPLEVCEGGEGLTSDRGDCDDGNGEVNPDADEVCDGIDNDCDEEVDNADDDLLPAAVGFCGEQGVCVMASLSCLGVDGWSCIQIEAFEEEESTCDGEDNDCDGTTDEGLLNACGECGDLPEEVCDGEDNDCNGSIDEGLLNICGACGDVPIEVCDGFDNDCDDSIDEGVLNACGTCGEVPVEVCDGADNDCDGETDEGLLNACGACGAVPFEVCDGADNDCDGTTDEGLLNACGVCGPVPFEVCDGNDNDCDDSIDEGVQNACGACGPAPLELCDEFDNDCDGNIDEGVQNACGSCGAVALEVCDGADNDCDGETDEGLLNACGACGPLPVEVCDEADNDCDGSIDEGVLNACGACGDVPVEVCDGADNDCDGETDEGLLNACGVCGPAPFEVCDGNDNDCDDNIDEGVQNACGSCGAVALEVCDGEDNDCDDNIDEGVQNACGACGPLPVEVCDNGDNDCDGSIDEGVEATYYIDLDGDSFGNAQVSVDACSAPAGYVGRSGDCLDDLENGAQAYPGNDEVCDGLDNDCLNGPDDGDVCQAPEVVCPGDRDIFVGENLELRGAGGDPDGGDVTYAWTVTLSPPGAQFSLSSSDQSSASFVAQTAGLYWVKLCVEDDEGASTCCTLEVNVAVSCVPPVAPGLTACQVSWDRRPLVEFLPLPPGVFYSLSANGSDTPYALIGQQGQNYHRMSSAPVEGSAPPAGESFVVTALACLQDDAACCSTSESVTIGLIEDCSLSVEPSSDNVVISEYLINGGGPCSGPDCEAGEAVELTNLSNCPVSLNNHHFRYCNSDLCTAFRYMNFTEADIIPPRGVYVTIRNEVAAVDYCDFSGLGEDSTGLFGLKISQLSVEGNSSNSSGWFRNSGGGSLRVATGQFDETSPLDGGETIVEIVDYIGGLDNCSSVAFDATDACGDIMSGETPDTTLEQNQLGRLSNPCDAVVNPVPDTCNEF